MKTTNIKRLAACSAAAAVGAAFFMATATQPVHAAAEPIGPKLTPRLKQMLSEEMLSVKQSAKMILDGLSLTEQDKKDLMKAASPEFLKLDGEFHQTAGKLAQAAQHKDYELQRFYYSRLVESCQSCHSQHATDRFPTFSGAQPEGHTH
ncbi:MAG: hypothetical protein ABS89_07320 [Thiobacillus sp. SCN 63-1177]|nr:MAG: hypothetical protein ABS89_07320 [Thiobacillus sp. SCN 63-1177]